MRGCDRGILMRRLLRRTAPFLFRSRGGACAGGVDGSDRGVVLRRGEDGVAENMDVVVVVVVAIVSLLGDLLQVSD